MNDQELLSIVHIKTDSFTCNTASNCDYKERTLSYAQGVNIPFVPEPPDELFKECCYTHYVLADENSNEDYRNDYSAFYHQKQLTNETCNFFLYRHSNGTEYPLINDTYGDYFGFGYFDVNPMLKGYKIEWKKVLEAFGEDSFKIIKRQTIAGITLEFDSITFTLQQFTTHRANHTVRMDVIMNGLLVRENVNFTDVKWKHSMRVKGFFGRREAKFAEDNLIGRDFEKRQVSMSQSNEYKFQTNLVPVCITAEIIDFMLFANEIYLNDYNLNNHSYSFVKFGVKLNTNQGTDYGVKTRKARINLVFEDKQANRLNRNY